MTALEKKMTKELSLTDKSDAEIDMWIANHQRKRAMHTVLYQRLIEERNRRHGNGLTLRKSIPFLIKAAKEERFVSYGELAEANGAPFNKVRYRMNGSHGHLQDILDYCIARGWPLLTAIVVKKEDINDGMMDDSNRSGFTNAAQRAGKHVLAKWDFTFDQQESCFVWAKSFETDEFEDNH
jgi:hypothetical protein